MPKASDFKRGTLVEINGAPHVVEDLQVQSPSARGGASFYKVRFRNLVTKQKVDGSYKGDESLPAIDVQRREVQFSYTQGDTCVFMDLEDYTEFSMQAADLKHEMQFIMEGADDLIALVSDGHVLTIEPPDVVALEIAACDPSIRGASASARTKPATTATGFVVQVPEYLSAGEVIRIDTRTGKFLSRA